MSDYNKLSKTALFDLCEKQGLTRYKYKNKTELIAMLQSVPQQTDESTPLTPTFVEVCAGGGGLSAGLIKSGFTPLLLNDNNKDCCKTLKTNHPEANVVCGSMADIDFAPYAGKIDLLTGGVPCQKGRVAQRAG